MLTPPFHFVTDTLIAALDAQYALYAAPWDKTGLLRVRKKYELMSRTVT